MSIQTNIGFFRIRVGKMRLQLKKLHQEKNVQNDVKQNNP